MTTHILDRNAFATWLSAQDANDVIGFSNDPCRCPLAEFIGIELEFPQVVVNSGYFSFDTDTDQGYRNAEYLPPWAVAFIDAIDRLRHHTPITAGQALAIMEGIPV